MSRVTSVHFPPDADSTPHPWKQYRQPKPANGKAPCKDSCAEPASKVALPSIKIDTEPAPSKIMDGRALASMNIDRPAGCQYPLTPFHLYHRAQRELETAQSTLRRVGSDPQSDPHGTLIVTRGALREALDAVTRLVEMEEGPFPERNPK